jgi:hypothetical protein
MKVIKVIIPFVVGLIVGLLYLPVKFWWQNFEDRNIVAISTCDTPPKDQLIQSVKETGNISAYEALWRYFGCSVNNEEGEEILPYALLMANKYHYERAYYHVYDCFIIIYANGAYNSDLDSLDNTTKKFALEYLQKGAELGEINCKKKLGRYYIEGKYFEKDTVLGKELKNKWSE